MARRGRPRARYKFKNFEKTYRRYVREYYQSAKKKWNRMNGNKSNARIPRSVSKEELRSVMKDKTVLRRADFREDYRNYKRDLENEGKTTDPIDYIVSHQTYEFSRKQYKGFKESIQSEEFKKATKGYNVDHLSKLSEFEFRIGDFQNDKEFFKAADAYYHKMKEEAFDKGYKAEKEQWLYAKARVSEAFFGRERTSDLYWGDSK